MQIRRIRGENVIAICSGNVISCDKSNSGPVFVVWWKDVEAIIINTSAWIEADLMIRPSEVTRGSVFKDGVFEPMRWLPLQSHACDAKFMKTCYDIFFFVIKVEILS